jgi:hypothetical protein
VSTRPVLRVVPRQRDVERGPDPAPRTFVWVLVAASISFGLGLWLSALWTQIGGGQ